MNLKEQLTADMKEAMKAREMERLQTIRFLLSEIKNYEIDLGGEEGDDGVRQKVVASQVKKINEAIEEFRAAGREDLIANEEAKVIIMEKYLPAQLSDEELEAVVRDVLEGAGEVSNQGQLIGLVMKQVAGQADGKRVGAMIAQVQA